MTTDTQTIADIAARLIVDLQRHVNKCFYDGRDGDAVDEQHEITGVRLLAQSLGVTGIQLDHAVQLARLDGRKPKSQPDMFGASI